MLLASAISGLPCVVPRQEVRRRDRCPHWSLVGHDKMMLRINRNLHVVANDGDVLATCRHRAGVRIGERDLLGLALHHLSVDRIEPDDVRF